MEVFTPIWERRWLEPLKAQYLLPGKDPLLDLPPGFYKDIQLLKYPLLCGVAFGFLGIMSARVRCL